MATRTRTAQASLLDDKIDILRRDVTGTSPLKGVFRDIGVILALVRVSARAPHWSVNVELLNLANDL